jgi:cytoskeleton protein RodZ
MAAEHEAPTALTPRYGVGDELRMQRESMGKSIADIVDAVRIQGRYLEALEDGRLDDLPGTVYALGFVRTYADFLGLDGPEIVARYKEETEGLKTQSYVMPEPLEEGKVPTAAILLVAVLLAAAAYGAWYFLSRPDGLAVQEVPEVPERLSAITEGPAPIAAPPAPSPAAAPVAVPLSPVEGDAPPPVVEMAPDTPTPVQAPPPAEAVAAAPVQAVVAPPPEPVQPVVAPAPVVAVPEASVAEQPPAAPEADAPAAVAVDAPVAVAVEAPSAPAVDAEPREPRVYGLGNVDARIIIIAEEDAWVEVTDTDDARLFSRVLRKGDSYRAPNREGAKFVTGNAGGLKIVVDGEPVPALGPPGQVRREVKLDPGLLKAGQAWP